MEETSHFIVCLGSSKKIVEIILLKNGGLTFEKSALGMQLFTMKCECQYGYGR